MIDLFSNESSMEKKIKLGHTNLEYANASSILTEGKGFMDGYDYTLNPYSGCSFGCNYCYAAFFSTTKEKMNDWGYWVIIKENALQLLMKFRKKPLIDKTIYLSSVTDPYQPIEKELEITRNILQEFIKYHQVRLVIQTRSPLVTRDIDLLKEFKVIQVNMSITTDNEEVRKAFEPFCPSNRVRLKAITEIQEAGINTCITMTPLLPIVDANEFAKTLIETGVKKFVIQPFHSEKGKFVASTREDALKLIKELNWDNAQYEQTLKIIQSYIPNIGIGKQGFSAI
ncbi:MAG: radical SAM protein [Runella slithyformis]|nr:MAG: radical SAM protein [Runella slithyformis]TAH31470.1 MAG: radical SAM protein [Cytophagales bacterium]